MGIAAESFASLVTYRRLIHPMVTCCVFVGLEGVLSVGPQPRSFPFPSWANQRSPKRQILTWKLACFCDGTMVSSSTSRASQLNDLWSDLNNEEKSAIIDSLSAESCDPEGGPVVIMDYHEASLRSLRSHLATLEHEILPAFLGGVVPPDVQALAKVITSAVAANNGTMVSSRVITRLNSFQAGLCMANATTVRSVLDDALTAAGVGTLVDLCHLVSPNRRPPNDSKMNTMTL